MAGSTCCNSTDCHFLMAEMLWALRCPLVKEDLLLLCRFSGVTEEDLENTSITLRDVQAVLLNMFSADTILIGHSLESDLFALKVTCMSCVYISLWFFPTPGVCYMSPLNLGTVYFQEPGGTQ